MKRIGNVIEEIVRYPNLYDAVNEVLSSTARKRTRVGRCILANREKEIESIGQQISSGSIDLSLYYERDVFDHGKQRHLQVLPLRKRIAINAVMRVVDKHLKPRFIRTTGASIEGRGMHDLMSLPKQQNHEKVRGITQRTVYRVHQSEKGHLEGAL